MFNLRKLVVLFVVSILSLGGVAQAASGSDGKGSDKHSSSDSKKSSNDKDHKSSDDKDHESTNGENKEASDDKQGLSDGESDLSLKDDGHSPSGGDNKDSWDGKIFGGHDFNAGLGHGGEHWNDYLTSSIPEPETYAMLLAGLSLLGFLSRRKKKDV